VERNHEGVVGKELAKGNGCFEILELEVAGSK
jgi:hypothetical protein